MENTPGPHLIHQARLGSRRAEILGLIQQGVGTVAALAEKLGLTDNAVRSHLLALERRKLVIRKGLEPGRRRPHELYQVTPRGERFLAHASDAALSAILTALKEVVSAKELHDILERGGAVLAERFATDQQPRPLTMRVQRGVRLLKALGGTPEIEKTNAGFRIRSQTCPLSAVVHDHPETCQLVENLLARVVRAPVNEACLRNGKSQCRFTISAKEE
jgi:predicted ArsR family transcriptional regulator